MSYRDSLEAAGARVLAFSHFGDGKKFYLVQRMNGKFSCTCKGFEFRKDCKHVGAVSKK